MKKASLFIVIIILTFIGCSSKTDENKLDTTDGLHEYQMGILRPGNNWTPDATPEVVEIQKAHRDNIRMLSDSGLMVLAGPFYNQPENVFLSGLFVYKTNNIQEARALAKSDPAVKAGRLIVEVFSWFGPDQFSFTKPWSPEVYVATMMMKGPRFNDRLDPEIDSLRNYIESSLPAWDPEATLSLGGKFKKSNAAMIPHSLFIIRADSTQYIDSLWANHPEVQSGILDPIVLTWYGPKGLTEK